MKNRFLTFKQSKLSKNRLTKRVFAALTILAMIFGGATTAFAQFNGQDFGFDGGFGDFNNDFGFENSSGIDSGFDGDFGFDDFDSNWNDNWWGDENNNNDSDGGQGQNNDDENEGSDDGDNGDAGNEGGDDEDSPSGQGDVTNLVTNGDFENSRSGGPVAWSHDSYGGTKASFIYPADGSDGRGAKVVITDKGQGDAKWSMDPVAVEAGETYRYSDLYRSDVSSEVTIQYIDDGLKSYQWVDSFSATSGFEDLSFTFTVPEGVDKIRVYHLISDEGSLTIDNVAVMSIGGNGNDDQNGGDDNDTPPNDNGNDDGDNDNGGNNDGQDDENDNPACTPDDGDASNLVKNGDLEGCQNGDPVGWSHDSYGGTEANFIYPAESIHGVGAKVVITSAGSGDAKWSMEPVEVDPGTTYQYSDIYRSSVSSENVIQYIDNGSKSYQWIDTLDPASGFEENHFTFSSPAGTDEVRVYHLISDEGSLTIDNVSIKKIDDGGDQGDDNNQEGDQDGDNDNQGGEQGGDSNGDGDNGDGNEDDGGDNDGQNDGGNQDDNGDTGNGGDNGGNNGDDDGGMSQGPYSVTPLGEPYHVGETINVRWTEAEDEIGLFDWIGLYHPGDPNSDELEREYLVALTDEGVVDFEDVPVGTYEFRLFLVGNPDQPVAVSDTFMVGEATLAQCSVSQSELEEIDNYPPPENGPIIAFGDSLTAGVGASSHEGYVGELEQQTGLDIINEGVPGDSTEEALARLEEDVLSKDPSVVLVWIGGNDILGRLYSRAKDELSPGQLAVLREEIKEAGGSIPQDTDISEDETFQNLRTIVERIQNTGATVVLIGFGGDFFASDLEARYQNVAEETGALYVSEAMEGVVGHPLLLSDFVHPNERGYEIVASHILPIFACTL